ncbi:MAG: monovalent cation/hydrogen antiporter [Solirubrobacteraceae bacterium]|nr:monovalent cation/hydrogen antiporter [Solirubrobacteraceae bacterium]
MDFPAHDALLLAGLLVAIAAMLVAAPRMRVPYPILLVLGGLAIGFIPGLPKVRINPDVILVGLLPPLLYGTAFFTSVSDLRANLRPIGLLSIVLVLMTTAGVALVAHAVVHGMSWPAAFVLGAVVSPTDPLASSAIARRLGVPRRIIAIIEGESLVNDGTALVAYRFAVVAVVSGSFSLGTAVADFFVSVIGGVAIGIAVGWLVRQVRRRLDDPPAEITISIFTGYLAYLPAQAAGVSGVLAAVTVGLYMGWYTPELTTAEMRLRGVAVWELLLFVLNAVLFVFVGLQLPTIVGDLSGFSAGELVGYAVAVSGAVVLGRFIGIFPATYLPRWLSPRLRERDPAPPWQWPAMIAWTGMRGAVSLAAALAIPLQTDGGQPFPDRALIVFLAFAVIFTTLVLQGLSLPLVIRALGLGEESADAEEEATARIRAAEAALERLEELASEGWVHDDTADRMRGTYNFRRRRFAARLDEDGDDGSLEERSLAYQRLRGELLEAERSAIQDMRRSGEISVEVMLRIERDLDLEHSRLDAP